uniref:Uncharacterized protein n=1 Tax=Vannella robusta TaxID=1487602 RepID=A0A7S4IVH3_9EUKA|mmetsp:Transcript_9262/g.11463  ORF Transcript_9262/g.11463 Transcript_9262/m.11463 type:complete len:292 (+) Transcript_9262:187-1062(+)
MSAAIQGLTGSVGACFSTTCTYPIDIVKTRIQAGETKGFLSVFFRIIKSEGLRGLFVGLSSQYIQTFLANFVFFFFYSIFRKRAQRLLRKQASKQNQSKEKVEETGLPASINLLVGILAAIAQVLLITPINVSLTRIKTNSPPANRGSNSLLPVLVKIAGSEGLGRLYAGLGPSLVLTVNPGIEFMIMETLKDLYTSNVSVEEPASSVTFSISAIAKIGATILTYPLILAKVRMQNSGETNLFYLVAKMFKNGGITAMYTGLQIQLIKAVLFTSIRNTAKEKLVKLLKQLS